MTLERQGPGPFEAARARLAVTARVSDGELLIDQATLAILEPAAADVEDLVAEAPRGPSQPWHSGEVLHTLTWVCQGLLGAVRMTPNR